MSRRSGKKFVEWEVLTGRLVEFGVTPSVYYKDPDYYNQVLWLPMDYQEWVDPLNDMQALILAYKSGQITFRGTMQSQGRICQLILKRSLKKGRL